MSKTYLSETGVNLVDENGNFVKKNKTRLPSHIERDGYYFRNLKEDDLEYEIYLIELEKELPAIKKKVGGK